MSEEVKSHHSDNLLGINILEGQQEFSSLEADWEDLYHHCPRATPFQSWAWLYSWWEHYGEGYELRLVTLRNDKGLLVGIIPLMLERRMGLGKLLFVGTGLTDYGDMLAREGWEARVAEAGRRALGQMDGWHVADLQQLRPEAAAWGVFNDWPGPRTCVRQDGCPVIDLGPWDELLMSLNQKLRSTVRRTLRRAEADGVRRGLAGAGDAERAARKLVALHREAWRGRDIAPEHLSQRFESHVVAAAQRMTACGLGGISEFWRDGEVIFSGFWVFGQDFVGAYMFGALQEAFRRYQVSSFRIWDGANIAYSKEINRLDLGRGEEPYKLQWNPTVRSNYRLKFSRSLASWAPYAGYEALRSRARRYANSESAPQWIQSAAVKYRALRRKAALRSVFGRTGKRS